MKSTPWKRSIGASLWNRKSSRLRSTRWQALNESRNLLKKTWPSRHRKNLLCGSVSTKSDANRSRKHHKTADSGTPNSPITPPAPVQTRENQLTGRLFFLKFALALAFVAIVGRLVKIQIIDGAKFQAVARKQYEQKFILPAVRGNIYDRNGNVLVTNTMFVSFAADPKLAADEAPKIAATFAKVLGRPAAYYLEKLGGRGAFSSRRFVWMERSVRPETARRIEQARLPGIVMMNEPKRLYHYDQLAGTLIGFTNVDNEGISGLELTLDDDLKGTSGSVTLQRDGLGRTRPSADYPRIDPRGGHAITLTVDVEWQAGGEEE